MELEEVKKKVYDAKLRCGELCVEKQKGHLTSALSCAEICAVLYYRILRRKPQQERDRFLISKNHGSAIVYPILADLGLISEKLLASYQDDASVLGTHARLAVPGIDFAGGSLGIGLGAACGLACAAKADRAAWKVYCLVGDCECEEGSIWESILFAGHKKLGSLVAIMDRNGEGCTDYTQNLVPLDPLEEKLEAFGWEVWTIGDGNCVEEVDACLQKAKQREQERPLFILANTVKGNGIPSMYHMPWLHGQVPEGKAAKQALSELRGSKAGG